MNSDMTGATAICSWERRLECSHCSCGSTEKTVLLPLLLGSKQKLSLNSKKFSPIAPMGSGKHFSKSGIPNFLLQEQGAKARSKIEENLDSKSQFTPIAPIAPIYINKNNIIYNIGGIYSL